MHQVTSKLESLHNDRPLGTGRQCQTRRDGGAHLQLLLRQVCAGRMSFRVSTRARGMRSEEGRPGAVCKPLEKQLDGPTARGGPHDGPIQHQDAAQMAGKHGSAGDLRADQRQPLHPRLCFQVRRRLHRHTAHGSRDRTAGRKCWRRRTEGAGSLRGSARSPAGQDHVHFRGLPPAAWLSGRGVFPRQRLDPSRAARDMDSVGTPEGGSSGPSKSNDVLREEAGVGLDHASGPANVSAPADCFRGTRNGASGGRVRPCEAPLEGGHFLRFLRRVSLRWKGIPDASRPSGDCGISQLQPRSTAGRVLLFQAAAPPKLENPRRLATATGRRTTLGRLSANSKRLGCIS